MAARMDPGRLPRGDLVVPLCANDRAVDEGGHEEAAVRVSGKAKALLEERLLHAMEARRLGAVPGGGSGQVRDRLPRNSWEALEFLAEPAVHALGGGVVALDVPGELGS